MNEMPPVFKICPWRGTDEIHACVRTSCALWIDGACCFVALAVDVGIISAVLKMLAELAVPEIKEEQ